MEPRQIFISHASEDAEVARILADTVRRTTLQQLQVWFSSDRDRTGGIGPGEVWTQTLFERLRSCSLLLTVVTPTSINHPWVHFESGLATGGGDHKVVPVCVGLDPTKLLLPLGLYQAYLASTPTGLGDLIGRLCHLSGANFDHEMARPVIEAAARKIAKHVSVTEEDKEPALSRAVQDHIDKRFYELTDFLQKNAGGQAAPAKKRRSSGYSVNFRICFPERHDERVLVVSEEMTTQELLDQMFFALEGLVKPYHYLQSWGLFRSPDKRPLITMAGGDDDIPASAFFQPNSTWEAWRLKEPFTFGRAPRIVPLD